MVVAILVLRKDLRSNNELYFTVNTEGVFSPIIARLVELNRLGLRFL